MPRLMGCTILALTLAVATPAEAQPDRWAGTWRGALTTTTTTIEGDSTDVTLTIVATDGAYTGSRYWLCSRY